MGTYLYAVIDSDAEQSFGPIGLDGGEVTTIPGQAMAAVVSEVGDGKLRPERRKVAAHIGALKLLAERFTVLPVAFGVVADDEDSVREIFAEHEETLAEHLAKLKGRIEMGLRVVWDVPNLIEHFIATHADLRAERDALYAKGRQPSQMEMIGLGRTFEQLLENTRRELSDRVLAELESHCAEVKELPLKSDKDVMVLACLLDGTARDAFEAAVGRAAEGFDDSFLFDLNGPWPANNFVEINLGA